MIFRKSSTGKSLTSKLCHEFCPALLMVLCFLTSLPVFGVRVQFDIYPATSTINIDQHNSSAIDPEIKPGLPSVPAEIPVSTKSSLRDFIEELTRDLPHIFTTPDQIETTPSRPAGDLATVLNPPYSEFQLDGKGEKELVAVRDGRVSVELFLWTYAQAGMEVRLIDTDGSEVWFNGSSLLSWRRPDSDAYAPVVFKGVTDVGSMILHADDDYNPKENLSYSFDVKEGQKIILRTIGNPEPRSYIRASGSAF